MSKKFKKLKFSIRKLSIGALSLSVGVSLVQPTILNQNIVIASSANAETGLQGTVSTEQELKDNINNNAQDIVLSKNIDITSTINIPKSFTGKIHGNGFTLKLVTQNINMFSINGSTMMFDSIVLDGNDIGRPLNISGDADVVLKKSTIQKGNTGNSSHGGGVYIADSKIKLDNSAIQDSKAVKKAGSDNEVRPNGGAIYAYNAEVTLENKSEILNNTLNDGHGNGGGIHATKNSMVKISDSIFSGNHTFAIKDEANEGGAVFVDNGTKLEVSNSTFNIAKSFNTGGAVAMRHATGEINNTKFNIDNLGDSYGISGGGIVSSDSNLKVNSSTFTATNSKLTFAGGFIDIVGSGDFTLTNSTLKGAGSWWNGPSIATYGGAIAFETNSTATATIENTTIKDVTVDENGGAITLATRNGEQASVNLTLRNTNIVNTRTKFSWKDTRGGGIYVGKGNTLRVDGGSITNGFSVRGGGIYNDGTVELGGVETAMTANTAYKYGGGIYNNGSLLVDTANFENNSKVSDGTAEIEENAGKTTEYAGASIYAKKDVTITPNAKFDEKDIRILDQESSLVLRGALTQKLNVSISEKPGGQNNETPKRQVGYLVAKGDGAYTPTKEDAKFLHYFTKDTVGISDYADHDSLAKWDYVLNPENNTVVLGQRVKVVYDANADNAKFEDGNKTIEDVLTVYKPDFAPQETTKVPTRDGYRFNGWYNTSDNQNDKFTLSKASFGITGNEITTPIAKESVTAYAAWEKEQKVTYEFKSVTEGKDLPQAVKDLLPTDDAKYKKGDQVTAKQPTKTEVEDAVQDGKWVFKGYEPVGPVTVGIDDVKFVGKWEFVAKEHNTTYKFESVTAGKELPQEVKDLLPTDAAKYVKGAEVTAKQPAQAEVTVADGKWIFKGYEPAGPVTVADKDVEFVGKWEYKANPVARYTVDYAFASSTAGKQLPGEVLALIPNDAKEYVNGEEVVAKDPSKTSVDVADGTWTFDGYQQNKYTVNNSNITFIGTWTFKAKQTPPATKYKATYEFTSTDATKALPAEVLALLPTDADEYENGAVVNAKQPAQVEVTVTDGKWTFNGYAANTQTVNGSDVKFSGTWTFTANATPPANKYKATYEFKSADATKVLPAEVLALLPTDANEYVDNDVVTATQPAQTEVAVADGKWIFNGYDVASKTVNGAGVKFTGTWTFIENKYKVTYRFESETSGKVLPNEVMSLLPTDNNEYVANDVVTAKQPTQREVTVVGGKWKFKGYAASSQTVNGSNIEFIGKWEFETNKYKATYEFYSGTEGRILPKEILNMLPNDNAKYVDGDEVIAKEPVAKVVETSEGRWTFVGYDKDKVVISGGDVNFKGKWIFKSTKPTPSTPPIPTPPSTKSTPTIKLTQQTKNLPNTGGVATNSVLTGIALAGIALAMRRRKNK
ncbi:SHIRT domain-containing protein [Gemella morbillorum]